MAEELTLEQLYRPGLEGIPVCYSKIGYIEGIQGILEYRGIRIEELAEHSTFSETSYLLLKGKLPDADEFNQFDWDVRRHRRLRFKLIDVIRCLPEDGHAMDALQTSVAALGMFHPLPDLKDKDEVWHAVLRLMAKAPTIIATFERVRNNLEPILPDDDLDHAANFLYILTGKKPTQRDARMLDICLILHAE